MLRTKPSTFGNAVVEELARDCGGFENASCRECQVALASPRLPMFLSFLHVLLGVSGALGRVPVKPRATSPIPYYDCMNANDIALTFDDGPYIYLRDISDQFTNANAKATFFMNGYNWDCIYEKDRMSDVKYAYAAGHQISSHTWSHADITSNTTDDQINDAMFRMEEAFSRILGMKPAYTRPPYGDYDERFLNIAAARNQSLVLWGWDTGDADGNTTAQSEAVYNDVANDKKTKSQGAIVLQHETEQSTATQLVPYAIQLFQSQGFNLVTLAECLGLQPYAAIGVAQEPTSDWTCDGTPEPGDLCGGDTDIACETGTPLFISSTASPTPGPTHR